MASIRADVLVRHIRLRMAAQSADALTDRALVQRFAEGDETAFAALIQRHGTMVLRVCRHVLRNSADTEDAFQAAFFVLARKAPALLWRESVAGWLHEVAYRVALKAKTARNRRRAYESLANPGSPAAPPISEMTLREAQALLNEELDRLSEKLRTPLVLCYLEGLTQDQAARQTGWSLSTLKRRLRRGLTLLRRRLERRGVALAAALSVSLLDDAGFSSAALLDAATRAGILFRTGLTVGAAASRAAGLAEALLKTWFVSRLQSVGVLLLAAFVLVAGGGLGLWRLLSPDPRTGAWSGDQPQREAEARPIDRARLAETARLIGTFRGGEFHDIDAIALSPDGNTLAFASWAPKLWDVKTRGEKGTPRALPSAHEWQVTALAFSPDGKTLASGSMDRTVKLWDWATRKEQTTLRGHTLCVYAVAFSPDGKFLASGGGASAAAVDREYRRSFAEIPQDPDWSMEHVELKVWDLATGKERTLAQGDPGRITSVAFSPDGKTLAAGVHILACNDPWEGSLRLWDVASGRERAYLRDNSGSVHAVAFSPDGKTLTAAQGERAVGTPRRRPNQVKLWDVASGRVRARLKGSAIVNAVRFSRDGKILAIAGHVYSADPRQAPTGEVRMWDAATGRPLGVPLTCRHSCTSMAFGPGGKILAVGGSIKQGKGIAGEITLWELGASLAP
jgi:RNA polymerase sigma factor (sigma-70 family)